MIVEIQCDSVVNYPRLKDCDPVSMDEFARRVTKEGLQVGEKLVIDAKTKPGFIRVQNFPTLFWQVGMETIRVRDATNEENVRLRNLRKRHEERDQSIKIRKPVKPKGRFYDHRWY